MSFSCLLFLFLPCEAHACSACAQGFATVDTMDTPDIKLFGKWSTDVTVSDNTLEVR